MWTFAYAVTRVWFSMSRDGLGCRVVCGRQPWAPGSGARHLDRGHRLGLDRRLPPIAEAAELTNIGILLAFWAVVCIAVIVLRYRSLDIERGFRIFGMPIIPPIGVGSSIWLTTHSRRSRGCGSPCGS